MIAKERLYVWLRNGTFDETKGCSHPHDVIAVAIGCSERTVIRCVHRLEAEGRVRVKRPRIRGQANTYWVDCWNPSKRCGVLNVLAGGREEVQRRRVLKRERELSRLARRAACHPNGNSRPSKGSSLQANPFLAEAVENQRCGREAANNSRRFSVDRPRPLNPSPELRLEVDCEECARKDRIIRQYAENHSKLVEEVSAAHNVARAAGKEVTKLRGQLTKQDHESARLEQVELVVECWRRHRPKASKAFGKPGSKSFAVIEKALVLMADEDGGAVRACCEAIDGLHLAPYQEFDRWFAVDGPKRTLRNSVEHALGDEARIERCRTVVARASNVSLDAKFRAYEVSGQVHSAWARVLMGELWTQPVDVSVVVDGLVVRP